MTTIGVCLGGTDYGRSGLGTYLRETLGRLRERAERDGARLVALGTDRDFAAYESSLVGYRRARIASRFDAPGPSALWHALFADGRARAAGADVLLLPSANRRVTVRASLPTVAVVHDLAAIEVQHKYDALRTRYVRHTIVAGLRRATVRVAISEATRADLRRALGEGEGDGDSDRTRVLYNGVDAARFSPVISPDDARVARARAALGLAGPYVLYPSRLEHPGKNHVTLLRAFARSGLGATHTLVCSGGDWGGLAFLEEEARALRIADRVRFTGHVSHDVLTGLVVGADAVTMVGLREGFGLPVLEALAAGVPVLVSRAGALPEVAGALGLESEPFDDAAMARALERTVRDEVLRARVQREGPAWARRFSWEHTAAGLYAACLDALAQRAARPDRATFSRGPHTRASSFEGFSPEVRVS